MPVICPKCSAVRNPAATAPDWQCPACGVAYAKVGRGASAMASRDRAATKIAIAPDQRFPVFKVAAMVALLVIAASWTHWKGRQQDKVWASVHSNCKAGQPDVVLYARTDCGYCHQVRKFFRANGICYTARVTDRDSSALNEFRHLEGQGVPLLIIGGERIDGYNREWMETHLQKWL